MATRKHTKHELNVQLESLESREAPTVGISSAWQTALAQAQNPGVRAIHFQGLQLALRIARPGTTFQGPTADSPGGASNANAVAGLSTGRAALLAQAQALRAAQTSPHGAAAVANRPWMAASRLRFPTNSPVTPVVTPTIPNVPTTPMTQPDQTNNTGTAAQNLPPNVSGILNVVYQKSLVNSNLNDDPSLGPIRIDGSNVAVNINGNGQGEFSNFVSTLKNLGMEISATSDVTWTVAGMLPISQLPTAAQTPQTLSITPQYSPRMN